MISGSKVPSEYVGLVDTLQTKDSTLVSTPPLGFLPIRPSGSLAEKNTQHRYCCPDSLLELNSFFLGCPAGSWTAEAN